MAIRASQTECSINGEHYSSIGRIACRGLTTKWHFCHGGLSMRAASINQCPLGSLRYPKVLEAGLEYFDNDQGNIMEKNLDSAPLATDRL